MKPVAHNPASIAIQESTNSSEKLESYLYEPVASHNQFSNDTSEDDNISQNNEKLVQNMICLASLTQPYFLL